jgi:hypothetical protein
MGGIGMLKSHESVQAQVSNEELPLLVIVRNFCFNSLTYHLLVGIWAIENNKNIGVLINE